MLSGKVGIDRMIKSKIHFCLAIGLDDGNESTGQKATK